MKTYIVRVWVEDADVHHDLRGTVHDVQSGDRHMFQSQAELLDVLTPTADTARRDRIDR